VGVNCFEYFQLRFITGRKVDAVYKRYKIAIKEAKEREVPCPFEQKKLTIFMHAEAQYVMEEGKDILVFYYNEAMV
jgi:hypothetical protein